MTTFAILKGCVLQGFRYLEPSLDCLWLKAIKIIDTFHLSNHVSKECKVKFSRGRINPTVILKLESRRLHGFNLRSVIVNPMSKPQSAAVIYLLTRPRVVTCQLSRTYVRIKIATPIKRSAELLGVENVS